MKSRKHKKDKEEMMTQRLLERQKKAEEKGPSSLEERNRIALAYIELSNDRVFQKLTEDHKLKLVKEVISIGDEVAAWVVAEYGTKDPRKVAAAMGVKVLGEDRGKARGWEYRRKKREIVVYRNFHEKLLREVQNPKLSENLLKYFVAHELFRHLEMSRIGEISMRYKFKSWQIGPFIREKQIRGLSRVAAQAFTHSLLQLEISPEVFDYLTYILYTNQ